MYKLFKLLAILFVATPYSLKAQSYNLQTAQSRGLGTAVIALPEISSTMNAVGGIGRLQNTSLIVGYDHLYGLEGLNSLYAGYLQRIGSWSAGLSISQFGDAIFSDSRASVMMGNKLGIASLGARVNANQIRAEGYETQNAFSVDIGGIAELSEVLLIGAEIQNINRAKYSNSEGQVVPTRFRVGVNVLPVETVNLLLEVEKQLDLDATLKLGLQYRVIKVLALRMGIHTNPGKLFAGLGFAPGNWLVDYAFSHQNNLGFIHSVGLGYKFQDK